MKAAGGLVPSLGPAQAAALAERALDSGTEERAVGSVADAARRAGGDARLWQWTGLLHRALDQHRDALAAFDRAARLAPGDARIAHGRAQVMLEAGLPALDAFRVALRLAPGEPGLLLGLAAARLAAGEGDRAVAELRAALGGRPDWVAGHETVARLSWMLGDRDGFTASYEAALAARPELAPVWQALVIALTHAERWEAVLDACARARAAVGAQTFIAANEAIARSELRELQAADALFAELADVEDMGLAVHHVRHLLRSKRVADALPLVERRLGQPGDVLMWPYASAAWRLAGDPRADWLDRQRGLVSVFDLSDRLPPLDRLADVLRGLHRAKSQHLDQSVRGGTQTDGALFSRIEPEIQAVRAAVASAVAAHVARLPAPDANHPTLRVPRDRPLRFAGSWSVRLSGAGHHANHVHPMGWISSALYVALPETLGDAGSQAGWLTLGAPQAELGLDLAPFRTIEPQPGRLVLFPGTMWHGTVPFPAGERLTVAFDIANPAP